MIETKKLEYKPIYDNRHLITDDFQYNSLVLSNLIDESIRLVSLEYFINLDNSVKKKIIKYMFIDFLQRYGLTSVFNSKHQGGPRLSRVKKIWEYISTLYNYPNILVLTHM